MAGLVVLDAGVLIALLDSEDHHHAWALRLFERTLSDELAISALTLVEVGVHPHRASRVGEFQDSVAGLNLTVRGVDPDEVAALSALRARTTLKMSDAVVLNLAIRTHASLAATDQALASQGAKEGIRVLSS
jgi:predicted nucleic acid-binding protein